MVSRLEAARITSRQDNLNEDKGGDRILALSKQYGARNTIHDDGMIVAKFEDTQALEAFLHDIENMECVDSFEILSNRKISTADEFLLYGDQIVVVVYLRKNLAEAKDIDYDNIPTHRGTDNEYYDIDDKDKDDQKIDLDDTKVIISDNEAETLVPNSRTYRKRLAFAKAGLVGFTHRVAYPTHKGQKYRKLQK